MPRTCTEYSYRKQKECTEKAVTHVVFNSYFGIFLPGDEMFPCNGHMASLVLNAARQLSGGKGPRAAGVIDYPFEWKRLDV